MPDWSDNIRRQLTGLKLHAAREAEIIEEVSQHLDEKYEELRRGGAGDVEARRLVLQDFAPEMLAPYMRTLRQANALEPIAPGAPPSFFWRSIWQDVRYALRMLRKERSFAAAAIFTLALGIGANSAIFALVDATLLRPLPLHEPERTVMVWGTSARSRQELVGPVALRHWQARSRAFETFGGFVTNVGSMVLSRADGTSETFPRQWVTADYFNALGVRAIAGRTFLASDDHQQMRAVVLSESFWRTEFNADPNVVGRALRLDGEQSTVVGVVPQTAQLLRTDMWALYPIQGIESGGRALQAVGRLKPGVTLSAAQADLARVADQLALEFPGTYAGRGVNLQPMQEAVVGADLRQTSVLFLAVVGFVLLICCANVANLLLARATARTRELAIRSALGADRARIVRQLLSESLVLSTIGSAAGLLVGAAILRIAPSFVPQELLPPSLTVAFDARVVAFSAATALLVGVLFGLVPSWHATRLSPARTIASHGRTVIGGGGRIRSVLVAMQIATAVVLLFGAGLLLRTLLAVQDVDRGYRAEDALTMIVDPGPGYPDQASLLGLYNEYAREIETIPGVHSAAWATTLPMGRSYQGTRFFDIIGAPAPADNRRPSADFQVVSPSYFSTLDLPIVSGRGFDGRDTATSARVCLVNEALARAHVPGRSPVGARVAVRVQATQPAPSGECEIVGVVRQIKSRPDETEDFMQMYVSLTQVTPGDIFLVVRPASGPAAALTASVRAAMARVDKAGLVSVREVKTLGDVASIASARHRFRAVLVGAFAALALMLAMMGLFGIVAYSVQQRVRDFGVRRALGATTTDVLWLVAGGAGRVMIAGAAVGLALAAFLARPLSAMLFGVQPLDPATVGAVIVLMAATTMAATVGPAWRAARIDPAVALRSE